jgi:hypothetical protein
VLEYSDINDSKIDEFINLLQCYYIPSERVLATIKREDLHAYMTGTNNPTFISFYNDVKYGISPSDNQITKTPIPIGCMASRPLRLFAWNRDQIISEIPAYYWDYICVHRDHRDKNLSRNIIQTHEYFQRSKNPDIFASLFKKEEILCQGIVPLVEYKTYTFFMRKIIAPILPPHFTVIRIFKENVDVLSDFLYGISHPKSATNTQTPINTPFLFCAFPDLGAIRTLLINKQLYAYVLKKNDHVYGLYFFKDAHITYEDIEDGGRLLECLATISNTDSGGLFFSGFLHALRGVLNVSRENIYKMILFNDLADNAKILEKWRWKYTPVFENISAYYLYNMIIPAMPLVKERCLLLV